MPTFVRVSLLILGISLLCRMVAAESTDINAPLGLPATWECLRCEPANGEWTLRSQKNAYLSMEREDIPAVQMNEADIEKSRAAKQKALGWIGIKNWKNESQSLEKIKTTQVLMIRGTYDSPDGKTRFIERHYYNSQRQVRLLMTIDAATAWPQEDEKELLKQLDRKMIL